MLIAERAQCISVRGRNLSEFRAIARKKDRRRHVLRGADAGRRAVLRRALQLSNVIQQAVALGLTYRITLGQNCSIDRLDAYSTIPH